jgi:hypothetical protein
MRKIFFASLIYLLPQFVMSQVEQAPVYSPDGRVTCMAAKGDTLIVGGYFNHVGKFTGCGALVKASSDEPILSFPKVIGAIFSSSPDGNGGFYIYGKYRRESENASAESKRIEHILPDNTFEPGFTLLVNCVFNNGKIIYHNGILYFGGQLVTQIGGQNAGDLAAIDVQTKLVLAWTPVIGRFNNSGVGNIVAIENTLYIMGNFTDVGGLLRRNIAAIEIGTGLVKAWNFAANFATPQSYTSIVPYGNSIIIGGGFGDGGPPNGLKHACAKVDVATGTNFQYIFQSGGLFGNGVSYLYWAANVNALAIKGDVLFAYSWGTFDTRVVAVNLADSNRTIWAKYFNMIANASDLAVVGNSLYVAGENFSAIYKTDSTNSNPANIERSIKGAVKLNVFTGISENWNPDAVAWNTTDIKSMSISGTNIFIGGAFSHLKGVDRGCVYMINTQTETILPFKINASYVQTDVNTVKVCGDTVFIGGSSLRNSLNQFSCIVAHDINTGVVLNWNPVISGSAFTTEVDDRNVYIGGRMNEPAGGSGRTNLFAIDRYTGALINWAPNPSWDVYAIQVHNRKLYVAGDFNTVFGEARKKLASFNTNDLSLAGWNPGANFAAGAIKPSDNTIWAGGQFFQVAGSARRLFAGVDQEMGYLRSSPVLNYGSSVNAFAQKGCYLFMGGIFRINNTSLCNNLTVYDLFNRTMIPSNQFCVNIEDLGGKLSCINIIGNDIYFGGDFLKVNGKANASYIGRIRYAPGFFASCGDYVSIQHGDWNNPSTWESGEVPPPSGKVKVRHSVTVMQHSSCYSLKVEPGGMVNMSPGIRLDVLSNY